MGVALGESIKGEEHMTIHTDEDDEFERIEHENKMKGQPYHFEGVYVSASQRNQVLEEAAKVCDHMANRVDDIRKAALEVAADNIRRLKK
jgi:hypothetical protein